MRGQGPGSNEIELPESHKLDLAFRCRSKTKKWQIEAKPTWHTGPRPKSGKSRLNLHGTQVQDQKSGKLRLNLHGTRVQDQKVAN